MSSLSPLFSNVNYGKGLIRANAHISLCRYRVMGTGSSPRSTQSSPTLAARPTSPIPATMLAVPHERATYLGDGAITGPTVCIHPVLPFFVSRRVFVFKHAAVKDVHVQVYSLVHSSFGAILTHSKWVRAILMYSICISGQIVRQRRR
jgi:hypothetical protein